MRLFAFRCFRSDILAGMLFGIASTGFVPCAAAASQPAFDPKPWLEDLAQAQEALSTKYANLEWVVFEHEIDLTALFAETKARVESASDAADARASFDRLARKLGDGHVRFRWSVDHSAGALRASCGALGFDPRMQGQPLAALMPGYSALASAPANEFPSGIVQVAGHRVGVLKIGLFSALGYPELCDAALAALNIKLTSPCNDECSDRIEKWASDRMTSDLTAQLSAIKAAGAEVLLLDVADNGGGTEWAEAAARMVTAIRLKSERVGFVRGPHWAKHFADTQADLRADAKDASQKDREMLIGLADQVQAYQREAETPCESQPLWQGKRPTCNWLGLGFYGSGVVDSADPRSLKGKLWATDIFTPIKYPYKEGVWHGPLIVLVNGGTGSAAEQFAAVLEDNHAAIIIGAPTAGAGCGHTNGGTPTTLKNSGGILELPDCARLRADGSNEVMGIQPDVLVGLRTTDGPHRQATRAFQKLPEAIERALQATPRHAAP